MSYTYSHLYKVKILVYYTTKPNLTYIFIVKINFYIK